MKIGFIITNYEKTIFPDIANSLSSLGHRVVIFTDHKNIPNVKKLIYFKKNEIEFFLINNKKHHPVLALFDKLFKIFSKTGERRFFTLLYSIYKFIKKNKDCDFFIAEWDWTAFMVSIVNLFIRFKLIVGVHELNNLKISVDYPGRENKYWLYKIKQWVYKRAYLIRVNSYVTEKFLKESGCNPEKIRVIPLHIPNWMLTNKNENLIEFRCRNREEIFNKYKIEKNHKLLITMCNLKPVKGLDLAILALPYILKNNPNITLMICGDDRMIKRLGSYKNYLENLAQKMNIKQHIIFTGFISIEEVKKYLAAADIHLAPSIIDTFNYAVVEAALVGTFSLVSSNVGSAYWVKEAKLCEIISESTPKVWANAVLKHLSENKQIDIIECSKYLYNKLQPNKIAEDILIAIRGNNLNVFR